MGRIGPSGVEERRMNSVAGIRAQDALAIGWVRRRFGRSEKARAEGDAVGTGTPAVSGIKLFLAERAGPTSPCPEFPFISIGSFLPSCGRGFPSHERGECRLHRMPCRGRGPGTAVLHPKGKPLLVVRRSISAVG